MTFQIDRDIPPPSVQMHQPAEVPATSKPLGLIAWLRMLNVGESILVPGKRAGDISSHMRAARRGTSKWFESKSMTTGARIWRIE